MSVFAERLVTQMLLLREKEAELEVCEAQLRTKLEYEAQTQLALDQQREQTQSMEELSRTLDKLVEAAKQDCERVRQEERARTQEMHERLSERITELAQRAEQLVIAEKQAQDTNAALRAKLEILEESKVVGKSGEVGNILQESDGIVQRAEQEMQTTTARISYIQELLAKETEASRAAALARDAVRAKVDEYAARFDSIREQLAQSAEVYEAAKCERERLQRTINALNDDRQVMLKRVQRSAAERNAAYDKMRALQEQLETVQKQTDKINRVADVLTNEFLLTTSGATASVS